MKRMKKVMFVCLIALMAAGMSSCKKNKADLVPGKWKIGEFNPGIDIPAERKADFDKQIDELKKTAYFEFKKDGSMEVSMGGNVKKGTWQILDDGKKFVTTEEGSNSKESLTINELTESKFSFSEEVKGKKITYTLVK